MSNARKITAITLITLLVSVALLGSGWITQTVSAVDLDTAIDLEAAPHFRDLTYTVGAPSYSTAFDDLGDWKVSVGNPKLTTDHSNMVITAPSTSPVRMSLTTAYASGINLTERSTVQIKVIPGNVTTQYSNVTLAADAALTDIITVSFHNSVVTLVYSNGNVTSSSTLYSPAEADAAYVVAYELAETGATVYLYDGTGNLLANKLMDVSDVHAGTLYSINLGVSANAGTFRADYCFVSTSTTDLSGAEIEMGTLTATDTKGHTTVQIDPTALTMTRSDSSITSGAYGMDDLLNSSNEGDNWIGTMGSTTEPSQRFQGQFVAVGWSDFRSAVEDELKGQIAKSLGILDSKQIYLVDYYIDYLQLGTTMDQKIVNTEMADYRQAMVETFENMGLNITATDAAVLSLAYTSTPVVNTGSYTMAILPPGVTQYDTASDVGDILSMANPLTAAVNYFSKSPDQQAEYRAKFTSALNLDGLKLDFPSVPELLGVPTVDDAKGLVEDLTGAANDTLVAMAQMTLNAIDKGVAGVYEFCNMTYLTLYTTFTNEVERWNAVLNATTEAFADTVNQVTTTLTGFFGSTVDDLSAKYDDMSNKMASLNAEYMNTTNQMMANTNAMFAQLFYSLQQNANETQRYFADQVTKSNEAVANISSDIALSNSQINALFADLLSTGKVSSDSGLSFGAFLGNDSYSVVIILVVVISVVAVVSVLFLMSGRKKAGRRKR